MSCEANIYTFVGSDLSIHYTEYMFHAYVRE